MQVFLFFSLYCVLFREQPYAHFHDAILPEEISHLSFLQHPLSRTGKKNVVHKIRLFKTEYEAISRFVKFSRTLIFSILETNPGPSSPKWNVENNKMPPLHRAARGNCAVFRGPFLTSGTSSRSSLERSITRSCRIVSDKRSHNKKLLPAKYFWM